MNARLSLNSRRGASVWKILAVIVVLAFAVAVLFPVFTVRCVDRTRKPACQNNLKELAIALQVYWNDYDSKLPSSMLVNGSRTWNRKDFLDFAARGGNFAPRCKPRSYAQVLWSHMKDKDVMYCTHDPRRGTRGAPVSYWWKCAVDRAWYGDRCTKPCRTEKDFLYNDGQIVLYERTPFHFNDRSGIKNGSRINAVFLDSHVEMITVKNSTSSRNMDCAANSDGEPMYFNFDNKTMTAAKGPAKWIDPARYSDKF